MPTFECDVCIIGGGISAALLAQKLAELQPGTSIIVVEAGDRLFDTKKRIAGSPAVAGLRREPVARRRHRGSGRRGRDLADDGGRRIGAALGRRHQSVLARRTCGCARCYGLAVDWPIEWAELERYYCEAERRIGVSGEPGPLPEDRRSEPYPMAAMPLSWNLRQLKAWAEKSGIPFWATPQAKNTVPYDGRSDCKRCNTCEICPTGARYSPD